MTLIEVQARRFGSEVVEYLCQGLSIGMVVVRPELVDGIAVLHVASWKTPRARANAHPNGGRARERHPADLLDSEVSVGRGGCRVWVRTLDLKTVTSIRMKTRFDDVGDSLRVFENDGALVDALSSEHNATCIRATPIQALSALGAKATEVAAVGDVLNNHGLLSPIEEAHRERVIAPFAAHAIEELVTWCYRNNLPICKETLEPALGLVRTGQLGVASTYLSRVADGECNNDLPYGATAEVVATTLCFVAGIRGIAECLTAGLSCDFVARGVPMGLWHEETRAAEFTNMIASVIHSTPECGRDPDRLAARWRKLSEKQWADPSDGFLLGWLAGSEEIDQLWPGIEARLQKLDVKRQAYLEARPRGIMAAWAAWDAA